MTSNHDDSDPDMEESKTTKSDSDTDFESSGKGKKKRSVKSGRGSAANKKRKTDAGPKISKCFHCRQRTDDNPNLVFYGGHPEGAVEEVIALTNESLANQLTEDGGSLDVDDNRPEYQLTGYSFYDEAGHIVSVDNEMLDRNEAIYFSGFLRPLTDLSVLTDGATAVCDGGPIIAWWICGYGPGESPIVGISTEVAHYYLNQPSSAYQRVMGKVTEKVLLSKVVIECLLEARDKEEELSYEDMMAVVEGTTVPEGCPPLTEESLINHAQFVIAQVSSYEEAGTIDEERYMMDAPCMRNLIQLTGLQRAPRKKAVTIRGGSGQPRQKKTITATYTLATTTPLVSLVFEECFSDQIAKAPMKDDKLRVRKVRCGVCESCQQPDCGECNHCKNMVKFGGNGKSKQACARRKCQNMIERGVDNSMSDDEDFDEEVDEVEDDKAHVIKPKPGVRPKGQMGIKDCFISLVKLDMDAKAVMNHLGFKWSGEPIGTVKEKTYYNEVLIGKNENPWRIGDFIFMRTDKLAEEKEICRIVNLYEKRGEFFAHLKQYQRGCYTILEETSDKRELFEVSSCFNSKLSQIDSKVNVVYWPTPDKWSLLGGTVESLEEPPDTDKGPAEFFYRMLWTPEYARFEFADPPCKPHSGDLGFCSTCNRNEKMNFGNKLKPLGPITVDDGEDKENGDQRQLWSEFIWERGISYKVGEAVFITPKQSNNSKENEDSGRNLRDDVDETTYPEYYRKTAYVKGSNEKTPSPFDIGIILEIFTPSKNGDKVKIKVRNLYRPAQTSLDSKKAFKLDLNLVYWSNDERVIDAENVQGKCFVRAEQSLPSSVEKWSESGEYRFYFNQAYNRSTKQFSELPFEAELYGKHESKGKGKGKGKGKSTSDTKVLLDDGALPHVERPLRMLDVFAGCGGLSQGLHEAGVADSHWAIEVCDPAARAFKKNNPNCTVFTDDCNVLLKKAMEAGDGVAMHNGKQLPQKGEVELLCGGPPCQGFSGMNRFNTGEYSKFKNSLIASYLAYCDFYRPKFFILENVRNFASFKKSLVLKLCLRSLVKMGYQCTFGVLQAGQFGVAQTRRRCILLAAAPGCKLPFFPEPLHVFYSTSLKVTVNDVLYVNNQRWTSSAPYRTITVRDIMSDLPPIRNGQQDPIMKYDGLPESHFQRMMRKNTLELTDHICKQMNPLVEKRMELIPTEEGSDWRDLPNIVTKLSDGTYSQKLVYSYHDAIQGKAKNGALRGVCHCAASRKKCVDPDKQENTLIPWCLPHTSNRHNHWAGLYGRVSWDGFFSTTVTNPEPMGKQGRVLHPEQARVVSVRECARSQGFRDDFHLHGNILDKHRQVGNAVPPPMGRAIGIEIRKVFGVPMSEEIKAAALVKPEIKEEVKDCGEDIKDVAGCSFSSTASTANTREIAV